MKRILMLMLLVAATVQASSAMPNADKKKKEKEKSARTADSGERSLDPQRLGRELGLNDDQSAAFAAIYAAYRTALDDGKPTMPPALEGEEESDLQLLARITDELDREVRQATVRREYVQRFLQVLTPQQLDRLYRMERSGGAGRDRQRDAQGERGGRREMGAPRGGFGGPGMGGPGGGFGPM